MDYQSLACQGQCTRENCRYLHPPPHLKTQLEIKGQNNIAARRMLQNQLQSQILAQQASPIPIQPTLLPTVPTTLPTGTPTAAATSQASAEAAFYHGHQYVIPVAYSMAPTVSHSTLSQHMYPGSYLSQAMQTALPTVATSTAVPGSANSTAHHGFSEIPLQTSVIPGTAGGPSFQFVPLKTTKNDRLEYVKSAQTNSLAGMSPYGVAPVSQKKLPTNRKRPREEEDQLLLMWNYFKDDSSRWQSSPEYSNYLQNHQSLSTCIPRPPKMQASMVSHQPQLAPQSMFQPNFLYNPMTPMTLMTQPQFLPAPHAAIAGLNNYNVPMMPTPAIPFMTQHFLQNQNTSETLPVCRDFKSGNCKRPNCKYAHVVEDYVEITDGKVTVCRYAVQNRCTRPRCKFYHPPTSPVAVVNSLPSMPTSGVTTA